MEKNKELPKIGCYDFLIEPFHCDFSKKIFWGHLGNHFLNASDFHSNDRGYGIHYLQSRKLTWVLSRLAIEVDQLPFAYETVQIKTWIDDVKRLFTNRNFKICNKEGKVYGYGKSVWVIINTETRQPINLLDLNGGAISNYIDKDEECRIKDLNRVQTPDDLAFVKKIDTHYSDVDMNGHINSIKYIEHILDLWQLDWYKEFRVKRIDLAYVAEAHQGDKLNFYTSKEEQTDGSLAYYIKITKTNDAIPETLVCRAKVIFVKINEAK